MHVQRFAGGVCAYAPAKLNLFFEVLAKRADGYHDIETLLVPLNWYDTLWFRDEPGRRDISLECQWARSALLGKPAVAREAQVDNLCHPTGETPVPPEAQAGNTLTPALSGSTELTEV